MDLYRKIFKTSKKQQQGVLAEPLLSPRGENNPGLRQYTGQPLQPMQSQPLPPGNTRAPAFDQNRDTKPRSSSEGAGPNAGAAASQSAGDQGQPSSSFAGLSSGGGGGGGGQYRREEEQLPLRTVSSREVLSSLPKM